jgi:hypothetical protein
MIWKCPQENGQTGFASTLLREPVEPDEDEFDIPRTIDVYLFRLFRTSSDFAATL